MKYTPKQFEFTVQQEICRLLEVAGKQFKVKNAPTVEEIESSAEKITSHLAKLTGIPMKTLVSRFLFLYYLDIKNKNTLEKL